MIFIINAIVFAFLFVMWQCVEKGFVDWHNFIVKMVLGALAVANGLNAMDSFGYIVRV